MLSKDFLNTENALQGLVAENDRLREWIEHLSRRLKDKDAEIERLKANG